MIVESARALGKFAGPMCCCARTRSFSDGLFWLFTALSRRSRCRLAWFAEQIPAFLFPTAGCDLACPLVTASAQHVLRRGALRSDCGILEGNSAILKTPSCRLALP